MKIGKLLQSLDLGNSVAEYDASLEKYFVETTTYRDLINDRGDIVAGDKGTGKTALFQILQKKHKETKELKGIELIAGFNPAGSPVFQKLAQARALSESQYITIWKGYILSLTGNWLLERYSETYPSEDIKELDRLLLSLNLRTRDNSAKNIFLKLMDVLKRFVQPTAAEVGLELSPEGMPKITPRLEFDKASEKNENSDDIGVVNSEYALSLLNKILANEKIKVWIVLDRLDEAFQGSDATEIPALRALFRSYLDLSEFEQIYLKMFVRKDLFRRITAGNFVNLTHVNARKIEIVWDDDDLFALLCRRIRESPNFVNQILTDTDTDEKLFDAIFPDQVVQGSRRPTAWNWVLSRIRDGNGVKPPRNLIDLMKKSQDAQLKQEERIGRDYTESTIILEPDAIQRALTSLSKDRVQDTLLAEAGILSPYVEAFRDGKAEYNDKSLAQLFDVNRDEAKRLAKQLIDIGFLEAIGDTYKVPPLYRDGLNLTQGKAF